MFKKTLIALSALLALVLPAAASAAPSTGAVVFSKSSKVGDEVKGGLFAVRDGRLNQLTEDPTDTEPNFSPDGRTIAFARGGDIYSVRPDGSGQRQLSSGPEIDSLPKVAPNGRYVVFERRATKDGPASLYTVGATGDTQLNFGSRYEARSPRETSCLAAASTSSSPTAFRAMSP